MPDEKRVAEAVIKVNVSKVKEAQRSLDKTTVTLPRAMRIAQVDIEQNQVVNLQQEMFIAHGIDVMEVEAQLSIHDMQTLASSFKQFLAIPQEFLILMKRQSKQASNLTAVT